MDKYQTRDQAEQAYRAAHAETVKALQAVYATQRAYEDAQTTYRGLREREELLHLKFTLAMSAAADQRSRAA